MLLAFVLIAFLLGALMVIGVLLACILDDGFGVDYRDLVVVKKIGSFIKEKFVE
jgi:hypothetical protein